MQRHKTWRKLGGLMPAAIVLTAALAFGFFLGIADTPQTSAAAPPPSGAAAARAAQDRLNLPGGTAPGAPTPPPMPGPAVAGKPAAPAAAAVPASPAPSVPAPDAKAADAKAAEAPKASAAVPAAAPAAKPAGKRQAPETIEAGKSCWSEGCHGDLKTGPFVHEAVKMDACDMCHSHEGNAHKFTYPATGARMCTRCHKELPLDKKMVHEPLKDKDSPCLTCHNPHKSTASKLLTADNVTALCARCHRDVVKNPMYHQADKVPQSCVGCHEAHASDAKKLLKAPSPDVCYKCHKELKERVANAAELHGPMNAGCQACHDPHQVKAGKGLAKVGPALCIMCHDDLKGTVASMEAHHKKPLEDKGCNRCHDPHAAVMKPMLMATQDVLCLRCHKDDVKTAEGQTLQGIGAVMVEGAKGHGPLANKQCTGCHEPHGNTEFRFLTGAYPATLYSAYKAEGYAFCAKCHEPTLTTARQTTTATKFRNGDLNLHYVHVNNPTKGRTCRMCHSPHASKNQHMLRDTLPFGDWHMPLGYTATETGGSCASGCHTTKSYDRDTPVTYAKPAPGKPVDKVVSPTEAQRGAATTSASAPSAAEKAPAASKPPAK